VKMTGRAGDGLTHELHVLGHLLAAIPGQRSSGLRHAVLALRQLAEQLPNPFDSFAPIPVLSSLRGRLLIAASGLPARLSCLSSTRGCIPLPIIQQP